MKTSLYSGEPNLRRYVVSHAAFLVLASGAACQLLANYLLSRVLSATAYGYFALVMIVATFSVTAGWLGIDQAVMRLAQVDARGNVTVPARLGVLGAVVFATTSVVMAIYCYYRGMALFEAAATCVILWGLGASSVHANLLRFQGRLIAAQSYANLWRWGVLIAAVSVSLLARPGQALSATIVLMATIGMLSVCVLLIHLRRQPITSIRAGKSMGMGYVPPFALSLILTALAGIADRVLVERKLGIQALGEYFLVANFLVLPFMLLASYIGFTKLVAYKRIFQSVAFWRDLRQATVITVVLYSVVVAAVVLSRELSWLQLSIRPSPVLIACCGGLVVLRVAYAVISSGLGAQGSPTALLRSNTAFAVVSFGIVVTAWPHTISLEWAVAVAMVIWAARCGFGMYGVLLSVRRGNTLSR